MIKGKIEKIEEKTAGKRKYYRLLIDGQWFSYWVSKCDFHEGDWVFYNYTEKDNWKNITEIKGTDIEVSEHSDTSEERIIRSVALKCAVELIKAIPEQNREKADLKVVTFMLADEFTKYIKGE